MKTGVLLLTLVVLAAPARAQDPPTLSIRPFVMGTAQWFTAVDSFDAVFEENRAPFVGGGVQVVLFDRFVAEVGASRFKTLHFCAAFGASLRDEKSNSLIACRRSLFAGFSRLLTMALSMPFPLPRSLGSQSLASTNSALPGSFGGALFAQSRAAALIALFGRLLSSLFWSCFCHSLALPIFSS